MKSSRREARPFLTDDRPRMTARAVTRRDGRSGRARWGAFVVVSVGALVASSVVVVGGEGAELDAAAVGGAFSSIKKMTQSISSSASDAFKSATKSPTSATTTTKGGYDDAYCYPKSACESGGSNDFDKKQRNMCKMLADETLYCVSPASDEEADCGRELRYHAWCDTNRYVFESGCLPKYPTTDTSSCSNCNFDSYETAYWSVGAPYPVHTDMVNQELRQCVLEYVAETLKSEYAAESMTLSDESADALALQEFPADQMDVDEYKSEYDGYYLDEKDFDELALDSSEENADELDSDVVSETLTKTAIVDKSKGSNQCFDLCTSDLGLKDKYKIKVPKVCAKLKILGKKFKKCIKVPKIQFKVPKKCASLCVDIPGYDEMMSAVDSLSKLQNVKSVSDLVDATSALIPKSVVDELSSTIDSAAAFTKLASEETIDGVLQLKVLPNVLQQTLEDAQDALENVANHLQSEVKDLLKHVWGEIASSANELVEIVEDSVKGIVGTSTSSAELSAALRSRHSAMIDDVHEGVAAAFRGEKVLTRRASASVSARLGGGDDDDDESLGKRCLKVSLSCHDDEEYPMPWPEKFENISEAPGSLVVDFPDLAFALCAEIQEFKVSSKVGERLVSAFGDMFEAFFTALYEESGLDDIVDDIKKLGNGKFFSGRRRRLLSEDDAKTLMRAHEDIKTRLSRAEGFVLKELVRLSDRVHRHPFEVMTPRDVSRLGGKNAFEKVFDDFADDMESALRLMADTTSGKIEFTLRVETETSVTMKMGMTKTGDFLKDHLDLDTSVSGTRVFVIYAGLSIALDYEFTLEMPYYFKAEAEGTVGIAVTVEFPVVVELSKNPSVSFSSPTVEAKNTLTASIVTGLQIGAVATLEKAFVALCGGTVCVGPRLHARQDIYVGLDAYAQLNCDSGPAELAPMWSETYEYSDATKNKCTGSLAGVGAYLQIPTTSEIEVPIMLLPMPTSGGGAGGTASAMKSSSSAARLGLEAPNCTLDVDFGSISEVLYDFTDAVNGLSVFKSDNYHAQDLFAECTSNSACPKEAAMGETTTTTTTTTTTMMMPAALGASSPPTPSSSVVRQSLVIVGSVVASFVVFAKRRRATLEQSRLVARTDARYGASC